MVDFGEALSNNMFGISLEPFDISGETRTVSMFVNRNEFARNISCCCASSYTVDSSAEDK